MIRNRNRIERIKMPINLIRVSEPIEEKKGKYDNVLHFINYKLDVMETWAWCFMLLLFGIPLMLIQLNLFFIWASIFILGGAFVCSIIMLLQTIFPYR